MILAVNGGSATLKYALFDGDKRVEGKTFDGTDARVLDRVLEGKKIDAIGHRVVHGGDMGDPMLVTDDLLAKLDALVPLDPQHLPFEIEIMRALRKYDVPQVACFDTAFHRTMSRVARLLPLPRRLWDRGIKRYGFHGISYAFIAESIANVTPNRRVVALHLGSGASVCAMENLESIDTTMAMTPAAGIPMGTRSGDLDPGVITHLLRDMNPQAIDAMVNKESGLLGMSETSADVRVLLRGDERAKEALEVFCREAKKRIGAYACILGGLDGIVFAGGIGENAPTIRARICENLEFLGVEIDRDRNESNAEVISKGRTWVRIVHTDEEKMIARMTTQTLRRTR